MKSRKPSQDPQGHLYRVELRQLIDLQHPLAKLAALVDWTRFDETFSPLFDPGNGRPAIPTRLMVGLHYLKHLYQLSDEDLVAQWVENPYWQHLCAVSAILANTAPKSAFRLKMMSAAFVSLQLRYERSWSIVSRKAFAFQNLHWATKMFLSSKANENIHFSLEVKISPVALPGEGAKHSLGREGDLRFHSRDLHLVLGRAESGKP